MYQTCGSCPRCGAPLYTYSVWHAVTPPPTLYSCSCFPQALPTATTGTNVRFTKRDAFKAIMRIFEESNGQDPPELPRRQIRPDEMASRVDGATLNGPAVTCQ